MIVPRALSLIAACICGAGCAQLEPLKAPISGVSTVLGGAHIVLSHGDLAQLAETIRLSAGKRLDAAVAPYAVVGGDGATVAPTTVAVFVAAGSASFGALGSIRFSFPLVAPAVTAEVSITPTTKCPLSVAQLTGTVAVALRFSRNSAGIAELVLADAPELILKGGEILDITGCLAGAAPGALAAISMHFGAALRSAVQGSYVAAARATLTAVLPVGLEVAGQADVVIAQRPIQVRLRSAYATASGDTEEAGPLIDNNGIHTRAALTVAIDVSRHPCAPDIAPAGLPASPLLFNPPASPPGSYLLRRAVVLDRALLQHLVWAAQRVGLFCRRRRVQAQAGLAGDWASRVVPGLAPLVNGPPTRVRLWPGGAPALKLVDGATSAELELILPSATLEIAAQVGGVEVVVLVVEGTFRVRLAVDREPGAGLRLAVLGAMVDSVNVSSPLLPVGSDPHLDAIADTVAKLLHVAVRDAFAGLQVPGFVGASVVDVARVGDRLWLWLEQAPPTGG